MNHYIFEKFKKKLNRIRDSDYYGLDSPGLTCYLNSVLQVLFMTKDFREAIKRCCSEEQTSIDPHLESLFDKLENEVTQTDPITRTLGITDLYMQRDAAEYFEKILCLTSPEASKMFKGELNHKSTCHKCKESNDSRSFFWTLPLAMEKLSGQSYSVEMGLKAFFKDEKVCGDNQMYCNRCNEKQNADLECQMTQNPEVLTLLLKRFSLDHGQSRFVKLNCEVDVPQTLRLKSCTYRLYALVNHVGNLTGGHYTALIKSFENGAWYLFDDSTVIHVKQPLFVPGKNFLRSCMAYLLMYRKENRNPPKEDEDDQEDTPGKTQDGMVLKCGTNMCAIDGSRARNTEQSFKTKGAKSKIEAVRKVSVPLKSKPRGEVGARESTRGFNANEAQRVTKGGNAASLREKRNAQKSNGRVTAFR